MCQGLQGSQRSSLRRGCTTAHPHVDADGSAKLAPASQLDLGQAALEGKVRGPSAREHEGLGVDPLVPGSALGA
eukprot:10245620-Alexandrium_andersonii.AAC.1